MKLQYIGKSFGVDSLTNGEIYECLGVEFCFVRVIDDSGEDYLYSATNPGLWDGSVPAGKWKVIEDNEEGLLAKAIRGIGLQRMGDLGEFKMHED